MIGTVAGNYKIIEEVGAGGMGKVYRGIDLTLDREVAVKVLRPELMTKDQIVNRFSNEAKTLAKLSHPHIATLYSFFRHEEYFLMVLEFVRGERLDKRMSRLGRLSPDEAIGIFTQILEAMAYAHRRGIIHRDLKPNNVMITEAGEVKVMDFGIARVVGTERMTQEGLLVGTLEYMAPEQIRGHDPSPQTDIYSLGIMLYEMLTSRLPFTCKSQYEMMRAHIELPPLPPTQFVPEIPPDLEAAILKALSKEPADRFPSAEYFHAVLIGADPVALAERPLRTTTYQPRPNDPSFQSLASSPATPSTGGATSRHTPITGAPATPVSGQQQQPSPPSSAEVVADVPRPIYTRPAVLAGAGALALLLLISLAVAYWPSPAPTPSPSPSPTAATGYRVEMVRVTGTTFRMGRDVAPEAARGEDPSWAAAEWPAHQMPVASFEIDKYEVTNEEYALFVAATGSAPPKDWGGPKPPAGRERWPVRNVSQLDAQLFAAWRSKRDGVIYRLPTEEEWEYAAKGERIQRYPWGDEWEEGRANISGSSPKPVGSHPEGVSPWGAHDMLGNVGEWTSSFAKFYPGSNRIVVADERGMVVVRGGSFKSQPSGEFPIRITSRGWFLPSQREESIGFRLVRELSRN